MERIEILLRTIADELHAEAEGDDVLVEGDGKEEEPDGALDPSWPIRVLK